jgi:hypothetical protein
LILCFIKVRHASDFKIGFLRGSVSSFGSESEFLCATDLGKPILPEPGPSGKVAVFYTLPRVFPAKWHI